MSLVLGLGLEHSCFWPREGLSSERLFLALASDFFCVLDLGPEPFVLDSTSAVFSNYFYCCLFLASSCYHLTILMYWLSHCFCFPFLFWDCLVTVLQLWQWSNLQNWSKLMSVQHYNELTVYTWFNTLQNWVYPSEYTGFPCFYNYFNQLMFNHRPNKRFMV